MSARSPLTRLTSDPRWIGYSNAMNAAFSKLDRIQLSDIRIWRAEFLAPATKCSRTCLYFFSGPDFLYADTFYPDCNTYVLVSLERVESIPELQSVPPATLQNTLINRFKNFYQPDLRQYYATSSPKPLPFGFGYQYDRQDARLLLAVRR